MLSSHPQVYDSIGGGYCVRRRPDPRIAARITAALGDAITVCNVGAGTGSYEPSDRKVIAVEPAQTMIDQRRSDAAVVRATAEQLPFQDKAFDAALAVLTVHHWTDPRRGLTEMRRISRRQVVFTFDPELVDTLWLVRDYLPEIAEMEQQRATPIELIGEILHPASIELVPVPWNCSDGFQAAYWRRPKAYLKAEVRSAISSLSQLPASIVARAMRRLSGDLETGRWHRRYSHLLDLEALDFGYRLVVSESPS